MENMHVLTAFRSEGGMDKYMEPYLTQEQRDWLKDYRTQRGLSLSQVAEHVQPHLPGATAHALYCTEQNGIANGIYTPTLLLLLSELYDVSVHELLHGPYPYQTPAQWILAYMRAEISEGTLAHGLKTDIVDARRQVQEYRQSLAGNEEGNR